MYGALAHLGIHPRDADRMEIWEVARAIGAGESPDFDAPGHGLVEEWMRYKRGEGPKPTYQPTSLRGLPGRPA